MMGKGLPTPNRGGARVAPSSGGAPDKSALLSAIRSGTQLKKAVTNDRSGVIGAGTSIQDIQDKLALVLNVASQVVVK